MYSNALCRNAYGEMTGRDDLKNKMVILSDLQLIYLLVHASFAIVGLSIPKKNPFLFDLRKLDSMEAA